MGRHIRVFIAGLLISFLGTLPLGTLNITAFNIAATQNVSDAVWFALAVVLVELLVVRITLISTIRIDFKNRFFLYILPMAAAMLLYMAVSGFVTLGDHQASAVGSHILPVIKSSVLLGLLLSVLNPMHVPFWMGWNTILIHRKTLNNRRGIYSFYITGIGLGSISGLMIFIFAGRLIFQNYQQYSSILSVITASLYLGFSLYLLYVLYQHHFKLLIR